MFRSTESCDVLITHAESFLVISVEKPFLCRFELCRLKISMFYGAFLSNSDLPEHMRELRRFLHRIQDACLNVGDRNDVDLSIGL